MQKTKTQFVGNLIAQFKWVFAASVFTLSALVTMPSAYAVGLGEITVNSSLNEPLAANIEIINAGDLQDNQFLVSLASAEAFERAGVSRDFFLSRLQFSISRDSGNQRTIKIVSDKPVVEPYLDFLVQLQWPEGRVMRSYTLLLDLPIYREDQAIAEAVTPPVAFNSPATSNPRTKSTAAVDRAALSGDQHQVIQGDTLWNVAERLRPSGATVLQTMDSLYQQNARAFSDGDANRLMKGSVLRLPSLDEIREEAGDMVAAQIGLAAPARQDEAASAIDDIEVIYDDSYLDSDLEPSPDEEADVQLKLVSGSEVSEDSVSNFDGESASESAVSANTLPEGAVQQLSSELAVANDEVNKFQLENSELRQRLALLEAQVATMAALVEQAQKQADLDRAAIVPVKVESNLNATLMAVPVYFWAALLALILLLLVLILRRSQSSPQNGEALDSLPGTRYENYDSGAPNKAAAAATLHELDDLELDPDDDLFDESDTEIFDSIEETVGGEVFDMMVEAVAEAEVYLSLGNTPQAIQVLEDARAQDPADGASRLKLMEILFREGRKDELSALYEEILLTEDSAAIEMAAIIAGPQGGAVTELEEGADVLESGSELSSLEGSDIEGLELGDIDESQLDRVDSLEPITGSPESITDSPEPTTNSLEPITDSPEPIADSPEPIADCPELAPNSSASEGSFEAQHPELEDLGFSDLDLGALELDDLDLDSLDIQDFDIELDDLPQESKKSMGDTDQSAGLQLPGGEDLDDMLTDFTADSAAASEGAGEAFSALDDINSLDSADIKLDLANTYIEMGDPEGAREIFEELLGEADEEGKAKAQSLLDSLK
jgi:pilus assembly protein FimV